MRAYFVPLHTIRTVDLHIVPNSFSGFSQLDWLSRDNLSTYRHVKD